MIDIGILRISLFMSLKRKKNSIYNLISNSFSDFVMHIESYSRDDKDHVLEVFKEKHIKKYFILAVILLCWSLLGVVLDSLFLGGSILALVMVDEFSVKIFLPALIYFCTNFILKVVFAKAYLGSCINLRQAFFAAIPYVGSTILLGLLFIQEPLFLEFLKKYLISLRKKGLYYICTKFVLRNPKQ